MKLFDLCLVILNNLKRTKLRSFLSCLGVMIGTLSIILLVSFGLGIQGGAMKGILQMGSIKEIQISPQFEDFMAKPDSTPKIKKKLDQKLISEIEKLEEIKKVEPHISFYTEIKIGKARKSMKKKQKEFSGNFGGQVFNFTSNLKIEKGRELKKEEKDSIIIGAKLSDDFKKQLAKERKVSKQEIDLLNEKVFLSITKSNSQEGKEEKKNLKAEIIAILAEGQGFDKDYQIYMSLQEVISLKEWQENKTNLISKQGYDSLSVIVSSVDKVLEVQNRLKKMDLNVFSTKEMIDAIEKSFAIMKIILAGIGGIALIVASIGIINTMIMSVYERTKEIGIMKAIGASNKEIISIFLAEAGVIGLIGGILGAGISFFGVLLINFLIKYFLLQKGTLETDITQILFLPWWLILFGISFSFFIGIFAGIYPALKAAKLNPLDALRHE